ncbi:MAG: hypothetical protein KBD94_12740, partial [Pyrinomonadaceae bacterium]|nr:hypothetical protein [Pyrinomonadaceae bacterium]
MIGLIIFISVLGISFAGVGLYRRLGLKGQILAIPNERSSHIEPTPHGAGIVIVILCLLAYVPISLYVVGPFSWGYFIGAVLIAGVSFIDDIKTVPFFLRLF